MRPSRHPPLLASRHPQRTPPRLPTLSAPRERMGARTASLCTTSLPTAPSPWHPPLGRPTKPTRPPPHPAGQPSPAAVRPRVRVRPLRLQHPAAVPALPRALHLDAHHLHLSCTPPRHAPRRQEKTRSAKIVCKDSRVPAPARARAAASCAAGEQPPPPRAPVAPQTGCAQHVPWQGGAEAARARWVAWARFAHDGLSWVRTRDVLVVLVR